jgi:hypothetical protein
MTRSAFSIAAVLVAVGFGCQSDPRAASAGNAPAEPSSAGRRTVGSESAGAGSDGDGASGEGSGGATADGAGGADAGEGGASQLPPLGSVEVVTSHAKSCVPPLATSPHLVLPASATNPVYDRLGSVAGRRFATSRDGRALFTFDADGNASTVLNDVGAAASNGTELSVVFEDTTQTVLQRYDGTLAAQGESVALAEGPVSSLALASTAQATLVSWLDAAQLFARVLTSDASTELSIQLSETSTRCRSQAVAAGANFAIAWSCAGAPNEVGWALISDSAKVLERSVVLQPNAALDLVAFATTNSGQSILLHSLQEHTAYIVNVDSQGQLDGSVRAISGLAQAFDLVRTESGLSLSALLEDGITGLGRIADDDEPTSAGIWICLDQASPGGRAAIEALEHGDSTLVRYANGSEWLLDIPY